MPAAHPTVAFSPLPVDRRHALFMVLAGAVVAPLTGCGRKAPRAQALPPGTTVLALGDSLTSGVGASSADTTYPAVLAALTGWSVVNAGVSGHTSAQALERLPGLLQRHQPALVIVSIGGNDFLRRHSAADTRSNVRQICADALAGGAQALLVAVPELTMMAALGRLADHPMYAEIAAELRIPLHGNGWSSVLAQERLRADQIHANADGYARFAQGLLPTLRESGLLAR